jgi:hypothetical protein
MKYVWLIISGGWAVIALRGTCIHQLDVTTSLIASAVFLILARQEIHNEKV